MIRIFKERQLIIKMDTNLNMKTNPYQKDKPFVELKSSMFKLEGSVNMFPLEEYPYFTDEVKYPNDLNSLTYREKLEFFFNRNNFIQTLTKKNPNFVNKEIKKYEETKSDNLAMTKKLTEQEKAEKIVNKNEIVDYNIMTMLKCLFPIKYPYKNNIKSSYKMKIKNSIQLNLEIPQSFLNLFRLDQKDNDAKFPEYSYLKLEGKTYTVNEVIWLNDIFNHPIYKKIIKSYYEQKFFKKTYLSLLKSNINNNLNIFNNLNNDEKLLTEDLKSQKKEKDKNNNKETSEIISVLIEEIDTKLKKTNNLDLNKGQEINKNIIDIKNILNKIKSYITRYNRYTVSDNQQDMNMNRYGYEMRDFLTKTEEINNLFEYIDYLNSKIVELDSQIKINNILASSNNSIKILTNINKLTPEIKKDIKQYTIFFDEVEKIRKYYSKNQYLTDLQNDYFNKNTNTNTTTTKNFIELLDLKNVKKYEKELNTSIAVLPEKNQLEMYIRVDLIEGEVTDENQRDITCIYSGEKLTDKLDTLLSINDNPYQLNPRRLLYSIDEKKGYSIIGNSNGISEPKSNLEQPLQQPIQPPPQLLQGGNRTIKNNKSINNTRKLKSYYMIK